MARTKNRSRDLSILKNIVGRQKELLNELNHYGVTRAVDLSVNDKMRPAVRRGLVQMVGDIFELTNGLKDETKTKIGLNLTVIKQFRNTATHNYGVLSNETAFLCIKHCVEQKMLNSVNNEIVRLSNELNGEKR